MVLNLKEGNEWQYFDNNGLLKPWYTKPMLDVLDTIDLSKINVWEWGLGSSTLFYARNAKKIYGVDSNKEWFRDVEETLLHHRLSHKAYLTFETEEQYYVNAIKKGGIDYGIIAIDGIFREQCFFAALEYAKEGTAIIFDNYMQPTCEVQSEKMQQTVAQYKHEVFKEERHEDWSTLVVYL